MRKLQKFQLGTEFEFKIYKRLIVNYLNDLESIMFDILLTKIRDSGNVRLDDSNHINTATLTFDELSYIEVIMFELMYINYSITDVYSDEYIIDFIARHVLTSDEINKLQQSNISVDEMTLTEFSSIMGESAHHILNELFDVKQDEDNENFNIINDYIETSEHMADVMQITQLIIGNPEFKKFEVSLFYTELLNSFYDKESVIYDTLFPYENEYIYLFNKFKQYLKNSDELYMLSVKHYILILMVKVLNIKIEY